MKHLIKELNINGVKDSETNNNCYSPFENLFPKALVEFTRHLNVKISATPEPNNIHETTLGYNFVITTPHLVQTYSFFLAHKQITALLRK